MYLKNIPVLRTKQLQYQRRFKEKLCDVTCCMTAKSENYFRIPVSYTHLTLPTKLEV